MAKKYKKMGEKQREVEKEKKRKYLIIFNQRKRTQ